MPENLDIDFGEMRSVSNLLRRYSNALGDRAGSHESLTGPYLGAFGEDELGKQMLTNYVTMRDAIIGTETALNGAVSRVATNAGATAAAWESTDAMAGGPPPGGPAPGVPKKKK
ncbi:hypothetical protein [Actinomadura sp. 6N118]|uniref:hypothetical protein n=1 Tax=Actinomadura sp. 6N118 TaxID=3375151 RepID=UPI0037B6AB9B